jgi:hypothetical protein
VIQKPEKRLGEIEATVRGRRKNRSVWLIHVEVYRNSSRGKDKGAYSALV